jgi:hypothetical protein
MHHYIGAAVFGLGSSWSHGADDRWLQQSAAMISLVNDLLLNPFVSNLGLAAANGLVIINAQTFL